jgi:DNA-binding CsgD family transcriptional regulator/PAS domain-containing protein
MTEATHSYLHTHSMFIYKSKADRLEAFLQSIRSCKNHPYYLFLFDSNAITTYRNVLSKLNIPVDESHCRFKPIENYFGKHGDMEAKLFNDYKDAYDYAIARNFSLLYILTDMGFLHSFLDTDKAIALENSLDHFFHSHKAAGTCCYFYKQISHETIEDLRQRHDKILFSNSLLPKGMNTSADEAILKLLLLREKNWKEFRNKTNQYAYQDFPAYSDLSNEIVWVLDTTLKVHYVSQTVSTLLGRPPEEYLYREASEFLPPHSFVRLKSMAKASAQSTDVIERRSKVYRFYSQIPSENDQLLDMEHRIYPLFWNGELCGFAGTSKTGRKAVNFSSFSSQSLVEFLAPIQNVLPMGVVLTDEDGKIYFLNDFFSSLIDSVPIDELPSFSDLPCWQEMENFPPFSKADERSAAASRLQKTSECSLRTRNGTAAKVSVYRLEIESAHDSRLYIYFIIPALFSSAAFLTSLLEREGQSQRKTVETFDFLQNTFKLSRREREVAEHVVEGLQNKEIADQLSIAEITVKKHLSHIYQKCTVHGRFELAHLIALHEKAGP